MSALYLSDICNTSREGIISSLSHLFFPLTRVAVSPHCLGDALPYHVLCVLLLQLFNEQSMDFMRKILDMSGLSQATFLSQGRQIHPF